MAHVNALPGPGGAPPVSRAAAWLERHMEWLFLLPATLIVVGLILVPVLTSIVFSFNTVDLRLGQINLTPVGFDNYHQALFADPTFWKAVQNTAEFVVGIVIFETSLGLGLALLVGAHPRLQRLLTSILLIPLVMPPVVIALAWVTLYDFRGGVLDWVLRSLGVPPVQWLSSTSMSMPSVILADIWHLTPFVFLIFLAGLQALPTEPFEAAQIDGASAWQTFRHITLPLLRPVLLVVMLLRTIDGARVFDKVFVMTGGGPGTSSITLILHIYREAFRNLDFGYGAAMSVMMLIALSVVAVIYVRLVLGREAL